jgi:hypothetical protein
LHQESHVLSNRARLGLEHVDEGVPDPAALLLRVGYAPQLLQEPRARVHHSQIDPQMTAEGLLDLVPLMQPEQAMIHENTGEPVADGTVHQHGCHRRVDSAREAADHPPLRSDHLLDPGDLGLHEMAWSPIRGATADLEEEVVEHLPAPWGVGHLGVKLDAEEGPAVVLECSDG